MLPRPLNFANDPHKLKRQRVRPAPHPAKGSAGLRVAEAGYQDTGKARLGGDRHLAASVTPRPAPTICSSVQQKEAVEEFADMGGVVPADEGLISEAVTLLKEQELRLPQRNESGTGLPLSPPGRTSTKLSVRGAASASDGSEIGRATIVASSRLWPVPCRRCDDRASRNRRSRSRWLRVRWTTLWQQWSREAERKTPTRIAPAVEVLHP